jgi:hypothetical protein
MTGTQRARLSERFDRREPLEDRVAQIRLRWRLHKNRLPELAVVTESRSLELEGRYVLTLYLHLPGHRLPGLAAVDGLTMVDNLVVITDADPFLDASEKEDDGSATTFGLSAAVPGPGNRASPELAIGDG